MVIFGNKTVTLFNRVWDDDSETESWLSTVLTSVNVVATQGANISKSGLSDADTVKLYVDLSGQSKKYVQPKEYASMTDRSNVLTFTPQTDFFVVGDKSSVPSTEAGFFDHMVNTYDDVYRITTVDVYEDVMPHIEVGGK